MSTVRVKCERRRYVHWWPRSESGVDLDELMIGGKLSRYDAGEAYLEIIDMTIKEMGEK
jgi:hypothetical protein